MCNSGPSPTIPVENHWTGPTYTDCPDVVSRSGRNSSEIGVRSASFIALRRIRSARRKTSLLSPLGVIAVPNRSERLVSVKPFALTHHPSVVTASSRDCGKPFGDQAFSYSRGHHTPGV